VTAGAERTVEFVIPFVGELAPLRTAVHSVLSQTDPSWTLTVVEDGPQHAGASEWLASLGDHRVRHVLNPVNLGVAGNFQRCLDIASSEWVTFIGCDDELLPTYLDTVRRGIATDPAVAAVIPAVVVMDARGRRRSGLTDRAKQWLRPSVSSGLPVVIDGDDALASLLHGNWCYFPSICWRRTTVSGVGFRQDLTVTVDLGLLADLLLAGHRLTVLAEEAFRYRRHPSSVTSVATRDADRFTEEVALFAHLAVQASARRWHRSERAARWHVTSRLNALVTAVKPGVPAASRRALLAHATRSPSLLTAPQAELAVTQRSSTAAASPESTASAARAMPAASASSTGSPGVS